MPIVSPAVLASPEPQAGYRRCVGIALIDPRRHVFAAERVDLPGAWQMPQGGIDPAETPQAAGLRELAEEIGTARADVLAESRLWYAYDLPTKVAGRRWRGRYRGQTQKWLLLRFTGADTDIALDTAHPEFRAWRWLTPTELLDLIVPFKRPVYEAVFEEFDLR